jgi:hypothetical protein
LFKINTLSTLLVYAVVSPNPSSNATYVIRQRVIEDFLICLVLFLSASHPELNVAANALFFEIHFTIERKISSGENFALPKNDVNPSSSTSSSTSTWSQC